MVVILSLVQYLFAQVLLSISCLLPKIIERARVEDQAF